MNRLGWKTPDTNHTGFASVRHIWRMTGARLVCTSSRDQHDISLLPFGATRERGGKARKALDANGTARRQKRLPCNAPS
ncbi:hypothetical protein PM082_024183 [Marasmius tenuissimus]|nr:hypothetical protein PM082_024183 [Marasmius tenuissimus]